MPMRKLINHFLVVSFLFSLCNGCFAGKPLWSIKALTPTNFILTNNDQVQVQYLVLNNSQKTRTITIQETPGVSSASCILAAQRTCTMNIHINGAKIPASGLRGGPVLCATKPDGQADPNLCYQPS